MAKIRVHELAKEMGLSSKEMVKILLELGLDVKNHMSTIEDTQANWVRKQMQEQSKTDDKGAPGRKREEKAKGKKDKPESTKKTQPQMDRQPKKAVTTPEEKDSPSQADKSDKKSSRPKQEPEKKTAQASAARIARDDKKMESRKTADIRATRNGKAKERKRQADAPAAGKSSSGVKTSDGNARPEAGRKGERQQPASKQAASKEGARGQKGSQQKSRKDSPAGRRKDYSRPQRKPKHKKKKEESVQATPKKIRVGDSIQVRDLAEKLNKTSAEIVKKLMELGTMATINQEIDFDTVEILCNLMNVEVEHELSQEQKLLDGIMENEDSEEDLLPRPPIVTVMGHVDHGKTSLLDRVRKADVVSGEAGGITQHIGAYQVQVNGQRITFIDTPGHEAFTAMRARGAVLTDIVILVVAADDGVMPQTVEAINHIRAAEVPFIVALNKMDKPEANPERVMQQLTEYNIIPEEWGGDTMFIPVSAKSGIGIENLLEMVLLIAEIHELKANPNRPADGVVIEGKLDKGRGPVATVLIQNGTLNIGDCVVCGTSWARVRAMTDYRGRKVEKATPSMPVEITGWSDVPEAGERVIACEEKIAKELAELRFTEKRMEEHRTSSRISLDDFFKQMQDAEVRELNLIIKGDVQGSIEALVQSLLGIDNPEVKVNVIHSAVGAITETDVMLASASNAIIIGFNVRPDVNARKYAEEENIDVRLYRVIYEAIEDVKKAMAGLLDPEYKEKYLGRAEVRETFKVPNVGMIGGCYVIDGKMQRNAEIRVLRDGVIIYEGKVSSLKRFKDDAREVLEGYECGIGIKDFNDIKEGDTLEAYVLEEIPRKI